MNLGNLIENDIKEMAKEESKAEDEDIEDELNYDNIDELVDEDFVDHAAFLDEEVDLDAKLLESLNEDY
jgi:hypothetical protein